MAHLIDMSNQRANMAYVGRKPWHGLGQELPEGQDIDKWKIAAGMDFQLLSSPVMFQHEELTSYLSTNKVIYRSDTKDPLSIVSNKYKLVQPEEILEFFRSLTEFNDFQMETAGVLDGGRRFWALAKANESLDFGVDDIVNPYVMLATSCDGSMATIAQQTSIRVVCQNTLNYSLREGGAMVKVSHRTSFDPDAAKVELGLGDFSGLKSDIETMINKSLSEQHTVDILVDIFAEKDKNGNITNEKKVKKLVKEIMDELHTAPGQNLETTKGTAWGLMNAVTSFIDYRSRAQNENNRFKSAQFGKGAEVKSKVYSALLAA